jgi:hypothetical protein
MPNYAKANQELSIGHFPKQKYKTQKRADNFVLGRKVNWHIHIMIKIGNWKKIWGGEKGVSFWGFVPRSLTQTSWDIPLFEIFSSRVNGSILLVSSKQRRWEIKFFL